MTDGDRIFILLLANGICGAVGIFEDAGVGLFLLVCLLSLEVTGWVFDSILEAEK